MKQNASSFVDTAPQTGARTRVHRAAPSAKAVARITAQPTGARAILDAVCARYGVSLPALLGASRRATVVSARHVAAWLLRRSGLSLREVADELDWADHTTAMHAIEKVETMCMHSAEVRAELDGMVTR